jgi:uracil phosphoribosyltransferase
MLKIVDHLLVQEWLSKIRAEDVERTQFRRGIREIGRLISYDFANSLNSVKIKVKTPLDIAPGVKIPDRNNIIIISVLRAAIPMVEGVMRVFPEAQSGVAGAWRSDKPPFPVDVGYLKLPKVEGKIIIVVDPMLATGNTMNAVLGRVKSLGNPDRLVIFNIIASKNGLEKVIKKNPEVEIYTTSVEDKITPEGYIVPGLGDAGDLAFGKPCD